MTRLGPVLGSDGWDVRACQRATGPDWRTLCGVPAGWHVIWDSETMDNSVACESHADAIPSAARVGLHRLEADCTMPGSVWDPETDRCQFPDNPVVPVGVAEWEPVGSVP
jgi:hypothetical protein